MPLIGPARLASAASAADRLLPFLAGLLLQLRQLVNQLEYI